MTDSQYNSIMLTLYVMLSVFASVHSILWLFVMANIAVVIAVINQIQIAYKERKDAKR